MRRLLFKTFAFIAAFIFFAYHVFAVSHTYSAFNVKVTGKGPAIILIPGATCSGDEWNETVAHYSGKYTCHVLTLAGYAGTAPLPGGPYLSTIKQQIEQYVTDQKLDNVILIGHSIGGFLSLCIASEMKTHLQKVVVVDALPFFASMYNPNAADTFSKAQAEALYDKYSKMDDAAFKANQMSAAKFLCRDSTKWDMIANWGLHSDKKTVAYTVTEMMSNDMRKKISTITVPVLVLGAYCKMPEYAAFTRESVLAGYTYQYKACTSCTVHVAEDHAKHFIMYDAPDWYLNETDHFIAN